MQTFLPSPERPRTFRLVKTLLYCPCGERITAASEDELVAAAQAHLEIAHQQRHYSPAEILFMAQEG